MYKQINTVSFEEAVKVIKTNDRIHIHSVACAPQGLIKAMCERGRKKEFSNVRIQHLHTEGPAPYADAEFEGTFLFIFLLVVNLFHRTCFTIVSVPYSSLTARITDDSDERTKLTTARMLAASFGTFSISALAFPIVLLFGGGEESLGFIYLGLIADIAAIIILGITVYFVQERPFEFTKEELPSFSKVLKSVSNNYPFWIVFSAILILISTYLMFNNNLIYFSKYALGFHEYQGLILGVMSGSTLLAIPLWAYLAIKLGKKNTWMLSMTSLFIGFSIF